MERIILHSTTSIDIIPVGDIEHLHAAGSYTDLYLKDRTKITSSTNLKWFEMQLPSAIFFRAHNSYLINLMSVSKLCKTGNCKICLENGDEIPLSRSKKKEFLKRLQEI